MTRSRLLTGFVVILLLLGAGGGAWWYLFGAPKVDSAALVPNDTILLASIPNAANIVAGYQTSKLKTIVDSPNCQPLVDAITKAIGQKTMDVLTAFAPNLSGQSFIAVTHFDVDKPGDVGLIAALKPKAGLGDFNGFVDKLKATWPEFTKDTTPGTGNVGGVDYQWLKGPGAPDRICVAQLDGWIITTWGEAPLLDWIQRHQKKATTPSLAENPDYQKSLARVGKDPLTLIYINYHAFVDILQKQMGKTNPAMGDYFTKKLGAVGGFTIGTRFENGDIVDRISILLPRQAQLDNGMAATPCAFDTLRFTGPDTRLYLASNLNWQTYWKNIEDQFNAMSAANPMASGFLSGIHDWATANGLDFQHNIIDPLGSEFSIQMDWRADSLFPETALFIKVDKPDDFKPTIQAIIETVRKACELTAVIKELKSDDQSFATLKFIQPSPLSPTITENGPYLGVFMTENHAVHCYQREPIADLTHNADFTRQIGDKRNGANSILFLDTPQLLNRAYTTALPYLSMAALFNKDLAAALKDKTMPPDLTWLAPIGTWSCISTSDDDGANSYSVSGVGSQGILLGIGVAAGAGTAQAMGLIPKPKPAPPAQMPDLSNTALPAVTLPTPPGSPKSSVTIPAVRFTNPPPSASPKAILPITNLPPQSSVPTTNSPSSEPAASPNGAPSSTPDTTTNAAPAPESPATATPTAPTDATTTTNSVPPADTSTNSNASPTATPDATKTQ